MTTQPMERYAPEWTTADRLRRIRRDAGLNQEEFAASLGLKTQRYAAWEVGRNQPPMNEFVAIAKRIEVAYRVAAEWTLGLEMQNAPGPDGTEGDGASGRRDSNSQHSAWNAESSGSVLRPLFGVRDDGARELAA